MQHLLFWIVFIFTFATVNTWKDPNVFLIKETGMHALKKNSLMLLRCT